MVYGDAERRTDGIVTTITLTDRILLFVSTLEVETQFVHDFMCLLRESIFLHQGEDGQLHRSKGSRQAEHHAAITTLELLFFVGMAHHTEEHAVYTDRSFDDIGSVAFVQFRIEIFNLLTTELSML